MNGPARAVALLALLAFFVAGSGSAAPPAKSAPADAAAIAARRAELKAKVDAVRRTITDTEVTRSEAVDALKASDQAISDRNRRLYEIARERATATAELAQLEARGRTLSVRVRGEEATLARIVAQQYAGGAREPVKLVLSGRDPADVARMLHFWRVIGAARAREIASLNADRAQVEALEGEVRAQRALLDSMAQEEAAQKTALVGERAERARVLAQVAADLKKQRRTLDALQRDDVRLVGLLNELSRIARTTPPRPSASGRKNVPDNPSTTGFGARRGHLTMPVKGELAGRFGAQRESGIAWKGWFIRCPSGQEVLAIAAGRVVWADWLRGFGNLLIVDHGNGYMSLYGFNDALLASVGTIVREGQPVAQSGASGGPQDPGVYFEIRHDGKAVDPAPWFGR